MAKYFTNIFFIKKTTQNQNHTTERHRVLRLGTFQTKLFKQGCNFFFVEKKGAIFFEKKGFNFLKVCSFFYKKKRKITRRQIQTVLSERGRLSLKMREEEAEHECRQFDPSLADETIVSIPQAMSNAGYGRCQLPAHVIIAYLTYIIYSIIMYSITMYSIIMYIETEYYLYHVIHRQTMIYYAGMCQRCAVGQNIFFFFK